jgi:hypothetical protein
MFLVLSDPDPLVRAKDPRIRIRTKMSRIRNTGWNYVGTLPAICGLCVVSPFDFDHLNLIYPTGVQFL